jgi:hypothetical protein
MGRSSGSGRGKSGKACKQGNCTRVECNGRKAYPVALVKWSDSCEPTPNAEVELTDIPTPQVIYQAGFLVENNVDYVSIAGGWTPELKTFDYVISIPSHAVLDLQIIESGSN